MVGKGCGRRKGRRHPGANLSNESVCRSFLAFSEEETLKARNHLFVVILVIHAPRTRRLARSDRGRFPVEG